MECPICKNTKGFAYEVSKMTVKQQVLKIIQEEIDSVKHNFPFTHDDEVKMDQLADVYDLIDSMVKE